MKRSKIIALLLTLIFSAVSAVGCGAGNSSGTAENTDAQQQTTQQQSSRQQTEKSEEPYTVKMLGDMVLAQNTPLGAETIAKLEKKLNVKFDIEVPPTANYKEKVQIIMSSDNLPDVVLFNDTNDTLLRASVENGTIVDISSYLKNAPNVMKYTLTNSWDAVKLLGGEKIFGIVRSTFVRADGIGFRSDWLNKLGITGVEEGNPVTLEKFTEIMQKYAENDPDGNNKRDTYGFNLATGTDSELIPLDATAPIDAIGGAFGLNGWQKYDSEDYEYMNLKFSKKSDKFKKFLELMNTMYKNKWLDPDWPTLKTPQADDNFKKGKYGAMVMFPMHYQAYLQDTKKVNPKAEITWTSGIINPDAGRVTGTTYSTGAWGCWSITNACKRPEKIVEIFDYMLSDEMYPDQMIYGGEGSGFKLENGKRVGLPAYMDNPDRTGWNLRFVRRAGDPSVYISLAMDEKDVERFSGWLKTAADNAVISKDGGFVPPASLDAKFIDYKKKMNETITKIVVGDLPISAYNGVLDGWYKAGGEEYIKQMNEHIKALK